MAVRQEDARNPVAERGQQTAARKASAIIKRSELIRKRGAVERWSAWGVLLFSLVGTVVVMHGGWANVLAGQWSALALIGGLAIQGVLTWFQWSYGDRKPTLLYLVPLAIDTSLTTYGYGPIVAPSLATWMAAHAWPEPALVSWIVVALAALGMAWYPESRLID